MAPPDIRRRVLCSYCLPLPANRRHLATWVIGDNLRSVRRTCDVRGPVGFKSHLEVPISGLILAAEVLSMGPHYRHHRSLNPLLGPTLSGQDRGRGLGSHDRSTV